MSPSSATAGTSARAASAATSPANAGSAQSARADSTSSPGTDGTAIAAKTKATQRRMQGVSCDACKFRKVKCDRRAKVEKKMAEAAAVTGDASGSAAAAAAVAVADDVDLSCSVCTSHGLRCTFTQAEPKKRRGRRIVEIQAHQRRESSNLPPLPSAAGASAAQAQTGGESSEMTTVAGTSASAKARHISSYPSPLSTPSTPLGLFGIPGLTRSLLDACVLAYFKYCTPTVTILHADIFAARYTKYFELYTGNRTASATTTSMNQTLAPQPPLTELLILAVACAGAGLLLPPITGSNPAAKFKLQKRLLQRCGEILRHASWTQRLREEGADLIEAVYVLVDPSFPLIDDEVLEDARGASTLLGVSPDPLRVQPTSHEALVRLTMSLSIHRRPRPEPGAPADGPRWRTGAGELIDDREMFRRVRIFWNVFLQDSFRSFGARRTPLISEDQYDQDLPRWAPRRDGDFSASFGDPAAAASSSGYQSDAFFSPQAPAPMPGAGSAGDPSPASAGPQPARFSRYDALWLEAILRLCFITRTVGARSVSPRAQGRGVLTSDMEHAMSAFSAWQVQLPTELAWETQIGEAMPLRGTFTPRAELSSIAFRNSLKSAFLEVLFHGQLLGCWAAVKDYGLRTETGVAEATACMSTSLTMHDSPFTPVDRPGSVGGSAHPAKAPTAAVAHLTQPPAPPDVELNVRSRLEGMVTSSFLRMATLARQAAAFDILRASRTVLRDVSCSFVMWGCGLAADLLKGSAPPRTGPPVGFRQILEALVVLTEAVESVDSVPDTPAMVRGLREMLNKFPGGTELLARRARGENTSSQQHNMAYPPPAAASSNGSSEATPLSPSVFAAQTGSPTDLGRCDPHGLFGSKPQPPCVTQEAQLAPVDDIAALSSNADALFDVSNGFSAAEILDAQWLEQLAALPLQPTVNPTAPPAPIGAGVNGPTHGGQTDSYSYSSNGPAPSPAMFNAPGDARDYAANAWEMPMDLSGNAAPQQSTMDWLWGALPPTS